MDDRTGKIITQEEMERLVESEWKHYVRLTDDQYQAAQGMNRKQRRALARKIRRDQRRKGETP